ncbi:type III pantothenate kinase [soil metagenome]
MILAIDVGNTNTVLGLFADDSSTPIDSWRLSSNRERTADEWLGLLHPILSGLLADRRIRGAIIGSVVPAVTGPMVSLCRNWLEVEPLLVSPKLNLGITLGQDHPNEVGADRIANAVAAHSITKGAAIVVDLGTATKIEAITASGEFVGGVIAPGLGLSRDALAQRAARLFAVDLSAPARAIGRNTLEAVQSGVVLGHTRMVEGMVEAARAEIADNAAVLITGGHASAILPSLRLPMQLEPDLTLLGLKLIYDRNANSGS